MDAFRLHTDVKNAYEEYLRSFFTIKDSRILQAVMAWGMWRMSGGCSMRCAASPATIARSQAELWELWCLSTWV